MKKVTPIIFLLVIILAGGYMISKSKNPNEMNESEINNMRVIFDYCYCFSPNHKDDDVKENNPSITMFDFSDGQMTDTGSRVTLKGYKHVHNYSETSDGSRVYIARDNNNNDFLIVEKDDKKVRYKIDELPDNMYAFGKNVIFVYERSGGEYSIYQVDLLNGNQNLIADDMTIYHRDIMIKGTKLLYNEFSDKNKWILYENGEKITFENDDICVGFFDEETVVFCKQYNLLFRGLNIFYKYDLYSGKKTIMSSCLLEEKICESWIIYPGGEYAIIPIAGENRNTSYFMNLENGERIDLNRIYVGRNKVVE